MSSGQSMSIDFFLEPMICGSIPVIPLITNLLRITLYENSQYHYELLCVNSFFNWSITILKSSFFNSFRFSFKYKATHTQLNHDSSSG